jgi:hypothetical protein
MIRLSKKWLIYAALLSLLILAAIGITAKVVWSAAIIVSPIHPAGDNLNQDADADYVQGLAKHGIVKLPGYQPSPAVRWPL